MPLIVTHRKVVFLRLEKSMPIKSGHKRISIMHAEPINYAL